MSKRVISERWTIIGVAILMALALGLLSRGLARNEQRAQQLGALMLDRTMDDQRWRFDLLTRTFIWDLTREAHFVSSIEHRTDSELLARWLPLLKERYPILAIGSADDGGNSRTLQRSGSTWQFISTVHKAAVPYSTKLTWPMSDKDPGQKPDTVAPEADPRESAWYSQAMEVRQDEPVWSLSGPDPGQPRKEVCIHLSMLERSPSDSESYRVVHIDIEPSALLGELKHKTPGASVVILSEQGLPLVPLGNSPMADAWKSRLARWQDERPTGDFRLAVDNAHWVGRIMPFNLNGASVYIGAMIDLDPIDRWNAGGRKALWWTIGLLVLLTTLLAQVMLQTRNSDKRVRRQEKHSSAQARDLAQALGEREVLDREVHHRVKNNLQVVSSLLNLQAQRISGAEARAEFGRGKRRIDSMALVHHKLYRQRDLSAIDLQVFLEDLAKAVSAMFEPQSRTISFAVRAHGVHTDADTGIQLGMIVCELLANCYLHAFPRSTVGHIDITVRQSENEFHILSISDNGKGFEEDAQTRMHLGLEVVEALADQLDGSVHRLKTGTGTTVEVTFRIPATPRSTALGSHGTTP